MQDTLKKLKKEDLKVGMQISDKEQLSDIYDVWVILYRKTFDDLWTIGFFGEDLDTQTDKSYKNNGNQICTVFNDSIELEDNIYYEE